MDGTGMDFDVIFIDQGTFCASCPTTDLKLLTGEKIDAIFALDCFNDAKFKQVTANIRPKTQARYTSTHAKPPRARLGVHSYHEKLMREVTSNLNKINGSNLDTIAERIIKLIDANNVVEIVNVVLDKTCTNGTYMQHFVSMLDKFDPATVTQAIVSFAELYIDSLESIMEELAAIDYNDYDQFCSFLKKKNTIVAQNQLVITYIKRGTIYALDTNDLFDKLLNLLVPSQPSHIQDMLIQLLADVLTHGSCETTYIHFAQAFQDRLVHFISQKSKFLIEDVIKAEEQRHNKMFVVKGRRRG